MIDRQTDEPTDRQAGRHIAGESVTECAFYWQCAACCERADKTERQISRQTDRQTDREADRQIDRQTD